MSFSLDKDIIQKYFLLNKIFVYLYRKDGENVTWKWVQENQQIPFEEFTKFYTQLNEFIISKRNEYYNIEVECQKIAYENNKLLDIFPITFIIKY